MLLNTKIYNVEYAIFGSFTAIELNFYKRSYSDYFPVHTSLTNQSELRAFTLT